MYPEAAAFPNEFVVGECAQYIVEPAVVGAGAGGEVGSPSQKMV